ncbi:MAG TPA: Hsp70 family protein [Puia sp.]|jgi:molecular chaperone DnaK|nr:Hsp70 family protein [Puia sp.]
MSSAIQFAIDLGTTNSLIAKSVNGNVVIFKNPAGMKVTLPSVVAFRKDRILIGDKAREYVEKDPANVFACFKRKMGTSEQFLVLNDGSFKTPIELSTFVLQELRNFIYTGEKPESVVITIPASFDTVQSNATKEAGYAAGFREVQLLQEPIAASLAFANRENKAGIEGQWLVYDLGGGTFDVALVKIEDDEMKVVDHEGDNFLGGLDFDQAIITQLLAPYLEEKFGVQELTAKMLSAGGRYNKLYYQLLYKAEEAKITLSNHPVAEIEFEFSDEEGREEEVFMTITREQFDAVIREKVAYSIAFVRDLLQRNGLGRGDVAEVVLVGGSTYIPVIREMLARELGIPVNTSIDPTTAVVEGAAYYSGSKMSKLEPRDAATGAAGTAGAAGSSSGSGVPGKVAASGTEQGGGLTGPSIEVKMAYQANTRDREEYLAASVRNAPPGSRYRIVRTDGGYDSGLKQVADRISEMLVLLPQSVNTFQLKLYDEKGALLAAQIPEIVIVQGKFSIYGQPLPQDICLEVDDLENKVTHLEVIFERNGILPMRKFVTKTLSRTITKGSEDQLLINVLEGSRYGSPQASLPIGIVTISGKKLNTDLVKGCDIDLTFEISESRDITVTVYIAMIDEEIRQAFSPSSRTVNVTRMRQEVDFLNRLARRQLDKVLQNELYEEGAVLQAALSELEEMRRKLNKISDDDVTDTKYQMDDQKRKLARTIEQAERGGRMLALKEEYYWKKEQYREMLEQTGNQELLKRLESLNADEKEWINEASASFLRWKIDEMDRMTWEIKRKDIGYVTGLYLVYAMKPNEAYSNASEIKALRKRGDEALTRQNPDEIMSIIYKMYHLLIDKSRGEEISGTGLRG